MTQKGPSSFHDLKAYLETHIEEDRAAFKGMGEAINKVAGAQTTLDKKQDEQIASLNLLLDQAQASAEERGRRAQREEDDKKRKERGERIQKWFRFVVIPFVAILAHLLTKWLHL